MIDQDLRIISILTINLSLTINCEKINLLLYIIADSTIFIRLTRYLDDVRRKYIKKNNPLYEKKI